MYDSTVISVFWFIDPKFCIHIYIDTYNILQSKINHKENKKNTNIHDVILDFSFIVQCIQYNHISLQNQVIIS